MLICHLGFILDANALLTTVLPTCDYTITFYLWGFKAFGASILGTPGNILGPSRGHLGAIIELSFVHLASYDPSDVNKLPGM